MEDNSNVRRILVLGHSGFIGRHLKDTFVREMPGVEIIGRSLSQLDLTRKEQIEKLGEVVTPSTTIILCAAIKRQFGDSLSTFADNIRIVQNVCDFLHNHPVSRVVYFSSAAVYGEDVHNTAITEDTPAQPRSFYGIAKYTSECLLRKVLEAHKESSLLVVRPPLVYGPGDTSESYGPVGFVLKTLRRDPITLWGDGTEKRSFVFVEDLARAVVKLAASPFSGTVNIADNESHSFKDVLEIIGHLLPSEVVILHRERTKDKVDNVFCNSKLTGMLDSFHFTSLQEGIKCTIESLKSAGK